MLFEARQVIVVRVTDCEHYCHEDDAALCRPVVLATVGLLLLKLERKFFFSFVSENRDE